MKNAKSTLPTSSTVEPSGPTVIAYAVVPGPDSLQGWQVVSFNITLPAEHTVLYGPAERGLAAVSISQLTGRGTLTLMPKTAD